MSSRIQRVFHLGSASSYGGIVARKFFPSLPAMRFQSVPHQHEICERVEAQPASLGVIAVENSLEGCVTDSIFSIERRLNRMLRVVAETDIQVSFFLFRKRQDDSRNDGAIRLIAHDVAERQCRNQLSEIERKFNVKFLHEKATSNSEAARIASQNQDLIALTNRESATDYRLSLLDRNLLPSSNAEDLKSPLNDHVNARTRFWLIGRKEFPNVIGIPDRAFKTSFIIYLNREEHGVLHAALTPFAERRIPLLLAYPCPIPGRLWQFAFLMEVQGHIDNYPLNEAFKALTKNRDLCPNPPSFLGSYPSDSLISVDGEKLSSGYEDLIAQSLVRLYQSQGI